MIVCQVCQKNPATVHLTDIGKEGKQEVHFCEDCAREKGLAFKTQISIADLIKNFIDEATEKDLPAGFSKQRCPQCGLKYSEFKSSGRLGCPDDYEIFAPALGPLLERMHGAQGHVGKTPRTAGETARQAQALRQLRRELGRAVAAEDYERAAELRDRIDGLQAGVAEN